VHIPGYADDRDLGRALIHWRVFIKVAERTRESAAEALSSFQGVRFAMGGRNEPEKRR
jgi:hypothetical protein